MRSDELLFFIGRGYMSAERNRYAAHLFSKKEIVARLLAKVNLLIIARPLAREKLQIIAKPLA